MESSYTKGAKARRFKDTIRIPKVLDTAIEPLFSLPQDLISPQKCKRKAEELIKRKGKVQKFREGSYAAKRFREEEFRR